MLLSIGEIEKRINKPYWSNSLGVARSAFALCTLLTLLFNTNETLFLMDGNGALPSAESFNLFYMFGNVQTGKIIAIIILFLVISGYFPRYTAIPHVWVAYSYQTGAYMIEGGDQVSTILPMLLVPLLLLDNRKNHWITEKKERSFYPKLVGYFTYYVILVQVAIMYFHASVGKYNTPEWHNGTAAYYWINDPTFGSTGFIYSTLSYLFKNPYIMLLFSWGTLLGELLLFARLFTDKRKWIILAFIGGVFFHIGIVLMFGLVSFFFAMFGALVLYTLWLEDFPSVIKELKNSLFKRVKWIIKLGRVSE